MGLDLVPSLFSKMDGSCGKLFLGSRTLQLLLYLTKKAFYPLCYNNIAFPIWMICYPVLFCKYNNLLLAKTIVHAAVSHASGKLVPQPYSIFMGGTNF